MNLSAFYYTICRKLPAMTTFAELKDTANQLIKNNDNDDNLPEWRKLTIRAIELSNLESPKYDALHKALKVGVSARDLCAHLEVADYAGFYDAMLNMRDDPFINLLDALTEDAGNCKVACNRIWQLVCNTDSDANDDVDVCFDQIQGELELYDVTVTDLSKSPLALLLHIVTCPSGMLEFFTSLQDNRQMYDAFKILCSGGILDDIVTEAVSSWVRSSVAPMLVNRSDGAVKALFDAYSNSEEMKYWCRAAINSGIEDSINSLCRAIRDHAIYSIKKIITEVEPYRNLEGCDYVFLRLCRSEIKNAADLCVADADLQDVRTLSQNALRVVHDIADPLLVRFDCVTVLSPNVSITEILAVLKNVLFGTLGRYLVIRDLIVDAGWEGIINLHRVLGIAGLLDQYKDTSTDNLFTSAAWSTALDEARNPYPVNIYLMSLDDTEQSTKNGATTELQELYNSLNDTQRGKFDNLLGYIRTSCVFGDGKLENYGYTLDEIKKIVGVEV